MNDQAKVIELLTAVYPKTLSVTTLMKDIHHRRQVVENALLSLVASGRVTPHRINVTSSVYRLSESEALAQGFAKENPVRSSTEPLYSRPTYSPKAMNPSRHDATEAMAIMSRRGDSLVPFIPPLHMGSNITGGMR